MNKIKLALAVGAVLALTAGIGVATGAIPSTTDGTISACQAKIGGFRYLRPIDTQAGESCHGGEKLVRWNEKGPKGDPGPQGPAGPKGSGAVKLTLRTTAGGISPGVVQLDASCPAGTHVSGGGYEFLSPDDAGLVVVHDGPNGDLTKWDVEVRNDSGHIKDVLASAICAS